MRRDKGTGEIGDSGGDSGDSDSCLRYAPDVAVGPDGLLYLTDGAPLDPFHAFANRVRVIKPRLPGYTALDIALPSEDGRELYQFDSRGKHLV